MACCKVCCGCKECDEGEEGKCCCGSECCAPDTYCCNAECVEACSEGQAGDCKCSDACCTSSEYCCDGACVEACTEGGAGPCKCSSTCCAEGEYCCDGVCQAEPCGECTTDEDCVPDGYVDCGGGAYCPESNACIDDGAGGYRCEDPPGSSMGQLASAFACCDGECLSDYYYNDPCNPPP